MVIWPQVLSASTETQNEGNDEQISAADTVMKRTYKYNSPCFIIKSPAAKHMAS